jgi:hypothetical protein
MMQIKAGDGSVDFTFRSFRWLGSHLVPLLVAIIIARFFPSVQMELLPFIIVNQQEVSRHAAEFGAIPLQSFKAWADSSAILSSV